MSPITGILLKLGSVFLFTVMAAILKAKPDAPYSCKQGFCGTCKVRTLSGEVDHRDLVMTKKEHAAMKEMMICVSRPTCARLELDL